MTKLVDILIAASMPVILHGSLYSWEVSLFIGVGMMLIALPDLYRGAQSLKKTGGVGFKKVFIANSKVFAVMMLFLEGFFIAAEYPVHQALPRGSYEVVGGMVTLAVLAGVGVGAVLSFKEGLKEVKELK